jgi:hypothetical protein
MFTDSLLDNPWADRSRLGWTTMVSFVVQTVAAGGLLLLPLLFTQGMPQMKLIAALVAPTPPLAPPHSTPARNTRHALISTGRALSAAQAIRGFQATCSTRLGEVLPLCRHRRPPFIPLGFPA